MNNITQTLADDLRRIAERINWWQENKIKFEPLMPQLESMGADVGLGYQTLDISLTGNKADLTALWKLLRGNGYAPDTRPEAKATHYCSYWEGKDSKLWVYFTSTLCKRVQVGTEMREVAVYDIQCGDGEELTVPDEAEMAEQLIGDENIISDYEASKDGN